MAAGSDLLAEDSLIKSVGEKLFNDAVGRVGDERRRFYRINSERRARAHEVEIGTTTAQTFDGGNAMDSHAESDTPVSGSSSSGAFPTVPVNNGPGLAKGHAHVSGPASSSTVIQTAFGNPQSGVAVSAAGSAPTVTVVRPSMQTAINGNNNPVLTTATNVANQPEPAVAGITPQTLLLSNQAPAAAGAGALTKSDPPKTIIQTTVQTASPGDAGKTGNMTLSQPLQSSPGVAKGTVLQGVARTGAPASVASSPGTARAIAPQQVLAPRLPHGTPGQPNIQNIQLPPGMVLVRSEAGQLLMIPQQVLAQVQAQMQATRSTTPASSAPGQLTTQAPSTPVMVRPVPHTIIKQASSASSSPATTTLQRPPAQPPSVGSVLTVQPSAAQRLVPSVAGTGVTRVRTEETMENVKKCRNFLSTLIKLATSAKQSSQTAANVKDLVKNLLEGTLEAEDFTSRLYKELNSSPQPYLVPFLKRSLPALRQLTPDSNSFILQSQGLQTKPAAAPLVGTTSAPGPVPPAATAPPTSTAPRPLVPPASVLQSLQQGAIVKPPQVTLTTTPMVTLRGQSHGRLDVGQPPVQLKQLQTVALKGLVSAPVALTTVAQKNKLKDAAGGTFRDDDDINDVASMAGVNLSEESARILATNSELVGAVTRSCKDEAFLASGLLQHKILDIGKRFGVTDLGPEVVNIVSHATQNRLQNLLEKVSIIAQQKNMTYKEDGRFEQVTDVRAQLKFFEQLDQLEKQRKEEQEREILMKAAKSRSRQEDPEQLRLKQKAKEMQQQELAQIRQRDANLTALAAIGPRKKRKLDSAAFGTDAEGSGSLAASASASLSGGASRPFTRQRITRVNLRDLLFCLENERASSHSQLLYRALLK
ncbi:transcription initiation factor TFIID subunit 4 [Electrophorus electricus]|uniref:transcription initiation factor TFIID subunit 4 n=1 Tax=Electrophorus electricus TaxID=8005 RepID=UPI0015D055C9|nr:transcription initiation factor TFIID subunit 4 [Electrophorus electricus]